MVLTVVLMDIIFAYLLFFCSFDVVRFDDENRKFAVQIECYETTRGLCCCGDAKNTRIITNIFSCFVYLDYFYINLLILLLFLSSHSYHHISRVFFIFFTFFFSFTFHRVLGTFDLFTFYCSLFLLS